MVSRKRIVFALEIVFVFHDVGVEICLARSRSAKGNAPNNNLLSIFQDMYFFLDFFFSIRKT